MPFAVKSIVFASNAKRPRQAIVAAAGHWQNRDILQSKTPVPPRAHAPRTL